MAVTPLAGRLPEPIESLVHLAYNLRWSWHGETRELFRRLDPDLWTSSHHNPVAVLAGAEESRLRAAAEDPEYVAAVGKASAELERYLDRRRTWFAGEAEAGGSRIAYFSAEFAIARCLRVFSGGLGVLAGDHLKSASDLGVPLVGVGLLYREGYFTQEIDASGWQREKYSRLDPETLPLVAELDESGEPVLVAVPFPHRPVFARIWRAQVGAVPLYLLDTDVEHNRAADRRITDRLYGGDSAHRLRQELVLGIGGARALDVLGVPAGVYHLNEGHAAFAALERVRAVMREESVDFAEARRRAAEGVVFTTHTPVEAGHDYFAPELMLRHFAHYAQQLGVSWDEFLTLGHKDADDPAFCMTVLALRLSTGRNGVSRLHGEITREMWGHLFDDVDVEDAINHVTNGVHLPTWISPEMERLYTEHVGPHWEEAQSDDALWLRAGRATDEELWAARQAQRRAMIEPARRALAAQVERRGGDVAAATEALDPDALTIGFARRFATYKRATLLLSEPDRLAELVNDPIRPVQFVFAGKAHPKDEYGKAFLQKVFTLAQSVEFRNRFVFLEDYDVELARFIVQGVDIWLNTPRRSYEASGTSGMKAAANGVLNLSVPDGWWAEAWTDRNHLDHPIGWAVGGSQVGTHEDQDLADAAELYAALETDVIPCFYTRDESGVPRGWTARMRAAIMQLSPYFNTNRMVGEYVRRYYLPALRRQAASAAQAASASVIARP